MTEPTQAQIDEAENLKNLYLPNLDNSVVPWLPNIIAHIRREARNAALEEAAKVFRDCPLWGISPEAAEEMVLALKDQP